MPFVLSGDRHRMALDPDTGFTMIMRTPPQEGLEEVHFASPDMKLFLLLQLKQKFPERKVFDETNPGIMINAANLNLLLSRGPQFATYSFERKTEFAEYLIRMMGFINKRYPLAGSPYFWSNYADYMSGRTGKRLPFVFRMPSDEELLKLSLAPE